MSDRFGSLLLVLAVGLVVAAVRARRQGARSQAIASGDAPSVPASLRRLRGAGRHGRWHRGQLSFSPEGMRWRPYVPLLTRPVDLGRPRLSGERPIQGLEHWVMSGDARIIEAVTPTGDVELAVLPSDFPVVERHSR